MEEYDTLEEYVSENKDRLANIATGDFESDWIAKALLREYTEDWQ